MQFEHLATVTLDLVPQLQWLWHSAGSASFIVGDERVAFALAHANLSTPSLLEAARPHNPSTEFHHPCNLPIPESLYEEFIGCGWCGFRFLPSAAYDDAVNDDGHPIGDLLRTLVFGPDYGHYVLHPASGLVLGLRSGSIELLKESPDGFKRLSEARTRGRSAVAFAAHPSEPLIAYGDNYGNFHAHRFTHDGFGKTKKIAAKQRKSSGLAFVDEGRTLIIGGMGYLATYSYSDNTFSLNHEISGAVRGFTWIDDRRILLVNQGLHGVTAYAYEEQGFAELGMVKPNMPVQQMAVSQCLNYLAVSVQHAPQVSVFAIEAV